jgi:hypothetical protein
MNDDVESLAAAARAYIDAINEFIASPTADRITPEQGCALMGYRDVVRDQVDEVREAAGAASEEGT